MKILVAHASRYGATAEIAERIAETLRASGHEAEARSVKAVRDVTRYDAYVIGSALYFGRWLRPARRFVRRHAIRLAERPLWLFSSGPLGTSRTDAQGRDLRVEAEPKELSGFETSVRPRGHRVFFGALDPARFGIRDRLIWRMPDARKVLPEGDFRDWAEIEAWARDIAGVLLEPARKRPLPSDPRPRAASHADDAKVDRVADRIGSSEVRRD